MFLYLVMTRIHVICQQIFSVVALFANLTFVGPEELKLIIYLLILRMSALVVR